MEYVWKSSSWIGIFQPTKNTIDRQYTEQGQLWCQLYPRCQRLFMRGFWFRSSLKKVIPAIDRLETRSRSIQHGKSTRSAPEVFFSRLRHSYLRPSAEDGSACGRRISSSHATKKSSGTQGKSTITSVHNGSNTWKKHWLLSTIKYQAFYDCHQNISLNWTVIRAIL